MNLFNKILIVILSLLVLNLAREYIWQKPYSIEKLELEQSSVYDVNSDRKDWNYYKTVFTDTKNKVELMNSSLPLVLKGTVVSSPDKSFAIIDDLGKGVQGLYSLGDTVCGAKLIAMNRNRVVVEYNGQKQELKMFAPLEADRPKAVVAVPSAGRPLTGFDEQQDAKRDVTFIASRSEIYSDLGEDLAGNKFDFNKLLEQVRIKPYFEAGKCIGFQLISIRNGSMVERLGLKNGDIIESVNGMRINDPLKALQILYAVEKNNPVHLGIERETQKIELDCKVEG